MTSTRERTQEGIERVNVRFPKALMDDLRRYVPQRKRSEVIIAGTARMLAELKRRVALQAGAGAWSDERHPDLQGQEDVNRYLAALRATANERLSR